MWTENPDTTPISRGDRGDAEPQGRLSIENVHLTYDPATGQAVLMVAGDRWVATRPLDADETRRLSQGLTAAEHFAAGAGERDHACPSVRVLASAGAMLRVEVLAPDGIPAFELCHDEARRVGADLIYLAGATQFKRQVARDALVPPGLIEEVFRTWNDREAGPDHDGCSAGVLPPGIATMLGWPIVPPKPPTD